VHAYDFILILFSFVYAGAVTHLLSAAGEIIITSKRVTALSVAAATRITNKLTSVSPTTCKHPKEL
jgi:hypothetical protein